MATKLSLATRESKQILSLLTELYVVTSGTALPPPGNSGLFTFQLETQQAEEIWDAFLLNRNEPMIQLLILEEHQLLSRKFQSPENRSLEPLESNMSILIMIHLLRRQLLPYWLCMHGVFLFPFLLECAIFPPLVCNGLYYGTNGLF